MGLVKGTASGLAAVVGGLAAMSFYGVVGFIVGAMVGTLVSDGVMTIFGHPPRTGLSVATKKGLGASVGGAAGMFFPGVQSMMAGAFFGTLVGDLLDLFTSWWF